jgi:hypothetical protein
MSTVSNVDSMSAHTGRTAALDDDLMEEDREDFGVEDDAGNKSPSATTAANSKSTENVNQKLREK